MIDSPDPAASAAFYAALTGIPVETSETEDDWVQLEGEADGQAALAFQLAPGLTPPDWPGDHHPIRAHLDLEVEDLDDAERHALAVGARKAATQPGTRFRVFHDPTGHPFCLVLRRGAPD